VIPPYYNTYQNQGEQEAQEDQDQEKQKVNKPFHQDVF
jgi:hypothetical protein